jgi:hypothetical protein
VSLDQQAVQQGELQAVKQSELQPVKQSELQPVQQSELQPVQAELQAVQQSKLQAVQRGTLQCGQPKASGPSSSRKMRHPQQLSFQLGPRGVLTAKMPRVSTQSVSCLT